MSDSSITKKALSDAMKQLMNEKPFAKISIADICDICNMNRKSFYYHFKDKFDLVSWIFQSDFLMSIKYNKFSVGWDFFLDICSYFYNNKRFYMNAFEYTGQNSFSDYFKEMLQPILQEQMNDVFSNSDDSEFFCIFFADAFLCSIVRWLASAEPCEPEKFISLLQVSLKGAAKRIE